jgi:hypothetical protein
MSLALCKALSALSFWRPPIARTFSSSLVWFADAGHTKSTEELSIADKEAEARVRKAAYHRAWRQRQREDPEKQKEFKSAQSIANKKKYQRLKDDPERLERSRSRRREITANAYKDLSWRDKQAVRMQHWYHHKY